MSWQFFLLVSVIVYSISVLLQKVLLRGEGQDPVAFAIITELFAGALLLGFAFVRGFKMPPLTPILPNLLAMGIFYGISGVLMYRSIKLIDASEFTVIFASRSIWTILGAIVFLSEKFSLREGIGALLILSSVILVSAKRERLKIRRGEFFGILAAAGTGLGFVNDAYIMRSFDAISYVPIAFILPGLVIWLSNPGATKRFKPFLRGMTFWKLVALVVLFGISASAYYLAYQSGHNAAQLSVLDQTATVLAVVLAVIFLKERSHMIRNLLGATLSFLGVILVR